MDAPGREGAGGVIHVPVRAEREGGRILTTGDGVTTLAAGPDALDHARLDDLLQVRLTALGQHDAKPQPIARSEGGAGTGHGHAGGIRRKQRVALGAQTTVNQRLV